MKHLLEHRQELSQRMEAVTLERDQLHQNVTNKTPCHLFSLLTRVNRWESRSIEGIKRVANEVRLELEKTLDDVDKTIGGALRQISQELQEQRQTDRYTEIELNKWMRQLKELRKQLEKPTKIEMMYDQDEETSTRIPLIQLRIVQRTQGRDGKLSECFVLLICFSPSAKLMSLPQELSKIQLCQALCRRVYRCDLFFTDQSE